MSVTSDYEMSLQRRQMLQVEINQRKVNIDFACFKKSAQDKADLKKAKKEHRKLTKQTYFC